MLSVVHIESEAESKAEYRRKFPGPSHPGRCGSRRGGEIKRSVCSLVAVLASAISLYAEDLGKATETSGLLCNSMCVKQNAGDAACDQTCTDKTGDVVLVDDQGQVFNIAVRTR